MTGFYDDIRQKFCKAQKFISISTYFFKILLIFKEYYKISVNLNMNEGVHNMPQFLRVVSITHVDSLGRKGLAKLPF